MCVSGHLLVIQLDSGSATLLIEGPIEFVDHPDNISECSGSGVVFNSTTSNPGLGAEQYHWQRSCDDGVTWVDIDASDLNYGGVNGLSLTINDVAGLYDCLFRNKVWTTTCDTVHSNYAQLTVEGPISFTSQPQTDTICSGEAVSFSVTTQNTGSGAIEYQWQTSTDMGVTWFNLANNSVVNGVTTANLSIADVVGLNGRCYRVLIQTENCASDSSAVACLSVEGPIEWLTQPEDTIQCSTEGVEFSATPAITAGNDGVITYQWQASDDDGVNWAPIADGVLYSGTTDTTLTFQTQQAWMTSFPPMCSDNRV